MKPNKQHIEEIRLGFANMQSKEDLLVLLNQANRILYGEKAKNFELKQLTFFSNPKIAGRRYKTFQIRKKSGGTRTIHAPVNGLKSLQITLAFILQCVFEPHKAATGFVWEKSIVDNANVHVGQNYVFNLDLKDFFPTIDQARIWKCLQLKPFNLKNESIAIPSMTYDAFKQAILHSVDKEDLGIAKLKFKYTNKIFIDSEHANFDTIFGKDIYGKPSEQYCISLNAPIDFFEDKDLPNYVIALTNPFYTFDDSEPKKSLWLTKQVPTINKIKLANIVASLCCCEMEVERQNENGEWIKVKKFVLPQGAPTSPILSNVVCQRLDHLLSGVAKRFGLRYTRYADDITFSSMHNVYQQDGEFMKELNRIITSQGFAIKDSKTRLQNTRSRQEVTGLVVNEKVNTPARYEKKVRQWLYLWKRYGYDKAQDCFERDYRKDKGHIKKKGKAHLDNVIAGKLAYLQMVKGEHNKAVQKLYTKFEHLSSKESEIATVLSIWENEGIDKAMEAYYGKSEMSENSEKAALKTIGLEDLKKMGFKKPLRLKAEHQPDASDPFTNDANFSIDELIELESEFEDFKRAFEKGEIILTKDSWEDMEENSDITNDQINDTEDSDENVISN